VSDGLTNLQLLRELEPVAERLLNRHLSMFKEWNPHDYIPWSDGKNFYALDGQDWEPGQSRLSDVAQVAMVQNLLTEDNLPSYHREIAMNFSMDGPWGQWVNRWTAEENRHSTALRDYLVVTRAVDPVELEKLCMEQMTRGFSPGQNHQGDMFAESLFDSVMYVSFQELATRVAHRRQGLQRDHRRPVAHQGVGRREPAHDFLPGRQRRRSGHCPKSSDEVRAAHRAKLQDARIHGAGVSAKGGNHRGRRRLRPRIHLNEFVMPVLKNWRMFEREDFTGEAARTRDDLGVLIKELEVAGDKFEESKQRYLEREARKTEKTTAGKVLKTQGTLTLSGR
jgi:acyl-[acyl-carrier-protein] desaturase